MSLADQTLILRSRYSFSLLTRPEVIFIAGYFIGLSPPIKRGKLFLIQYSYFLRHSVIISFLYTSVWQEAWGCFTLQQHGSEQRKALKWSSQVLMFVVYFAKMFAYYHTWWLLAKEENGDKDHTLRKSCDNLMSPSSGKVLCKFYFPCNLISE